LKAKKITKLSFSLANCQLNCTKDIALEKMKISIHNINSQIHKNLNAVFDNGLHVITGPSGTGKTRFLRYLLGLDSPDNGQIIIGDEELNQKSLKRLRGGISWIPQNLSAYSNISIEELIKMIGIQAADFKVAMSSFELEINENKDIAEFSEGEKQRIFICIAKVQDLPILLADEPTSALDATSKAKVIEFLKSRLGLSIIISHDKELYAVADQIWELRAGELNPK